MTKVETVPVLMEFMAQSRSGQEKQAVQTNGRGYDGGVLPACAQGGCRSGQSRGSLGMGGGRGVQATQGSHGTVKAAWCHEWRQWLRSVQGQVPLQEACVQGRKLGLHWNCSWDPFAY